MMFVLYSMVDEMYYNDVRRGEERKGMYPYQSTAAELISSLCLCKMHCSSSSSSSSSDSSCSARLFLYSTMRNERRCNERRVLMQ